MRTTSLVLVAALLGFLAGRWTAAPAPEAPAVEAPTPGGSGGERTRVVRVPADCAPIEAERADLQQQLAFQKLLARDLELRAYGERPAWPDVPPPGHAPADFERIVDEAVEACGIPSEILGIDCEEPPCMVISKDDGLRAALMDCPTWTDAYGKSTTNTSTDVRCPDGSTERLILLGPGGVDYSEAASELDPWTPIKRLWYREDQARANLSCVD
ncbi:MAG: hypothetical protein H6739_23800 [Alphaproteobacteria bacterium]|nr:hypothetical protein [Alphaproteobacteria bacterium]